jgi:hypothetical protein
MTVSTETRLVSYNGNGSTTVFTVTFRFLENSHISVTLRDASGVETDWVENTQYTLTGAGDPTGTLTVATAPTDYTPQSGEVLVIKRNVPLTQLTDYVENDDFPAASHEDALDKLTMIAQELAGQIGLVVQFSDTVTDNPDLTLTELAAGRAGKIFIFDATGATLQLGTPATGSTILNDPNLGTSQTQPTSQNSIKEAIETSTFTMAAKTLASGTFTGTSTFNSLFAGTGVETSLVGATGKIALASAIKAYFDAQTNLLNNPSMARAQRGTTFDSTTTPANNDDTYLLDQWILLSDGNDVVDVTQQTGGGVDGNSSYIRLDVETISKKFGLFQPIANVLCSDIIGSNCSVSFEARVSDATKLSDIRAVVVAWDGTKDSITSDIVSSWNAEGVTPTVVANWTEENAATNLNATDSWVRYKIEDIDIDTVDAKNVGVFLYQNNTTTNDTAGTLLEITNAKLNPGSQSGDFMHLNDSDDLIRCQKRYVRLGGTSGALRVQLTATAPFNHRHWETYPVEMSSTPTVIKVGSWTTTNAGQPTVSNANTKGFQLTSAIPAANQYSFYCGGSDDYIDVSDEL